MAWLARYAPIVDDLEAFLRAAARPLPRVVWANPLMDAAQGRAAVARMCPEAVPLGWVDDAWRLPPVSRPGAWLAHVLGQLHTQEEAAVFAGDALGARPGERVLDLCAAPGGKSARIAVSMDDRGTLVSNDRRLGRVTALRRTLDRLGVTCAVVTRANGLRLRGVWPDASFDRVMVDAPCTCEGTTRKSEGGPPEAGYRESIVQVQTALLRRAIALTKPGGTLVYATCTYAPEENEAVLHAAPRPGEVAIEPIETSLTLAPGVTEWDGARYREDVQHAVRFWPHQHDTGGFFVARLRRLPASSAAPLSGSRRTVRSDRAKASGAEVPPEGQRGEHDAEPDNEALLAWLDERFGLAAAVFDGFDWLQRGRTTWLVRKGVWVPPVGVTPGGERIDQVSIGLAALRDPPPRAKPTSVFLQRFGMSATRSVHVLADAEVWPFLRRVPIPCDPELRGYVVVRTEAQVLGCGCAREGVLTSEVPLAWLPHLAEGERVPEADV